MPHNQTQPEPGAKDLWFLPLGGTGEIGMNLNLYGHDRKWLMVDCGVTFKNDADHLPDVMMADPSFIAQRWKQLIGIVVTHAHEDHIGAIADLWPQLECPVYATPFAANVLKRKLREARLQAKVTIHEVDSGEPVKLGPFEVRWLGITHSIPESQALLITTKAGRVFHTGDWKLDYEPVVGAPVDEQQFKDLAKLGIDAMVCDSTNAMEASESGSEASVAPDLLAAVKGAKRAVIVTTFASNLARLQTIAKLAEEVGRRFCVLGMSLENMLKTASETGYIDKRHANRVMPQNLYDYKPSELLIVVAGSQGDERAGLNSLAQGTHRYYDVVAGDCVIFSSRVIPGNEEPVAAIIETLQRRQVQVIGPEHRIHVSGHPSAGELRRMYGWVKPKLVIPTHGTPAHLAANADIAEGCGAATLTGVNGDLFQVAPQPALDSKFARVGRLGRDPDGGKLLPIDQNDMPQADPQNQLP